MQICGSGKIKKVKVSITDIKVQNVDWQRQQIADKTAAKNKANDTIKDGV